MLDHLLDLKKNRRLRADNHLPHAEKVNQSEPHQVTIISSTVEARPGPAERDESRGVGLNSRSRNLSYDVSEVRVRIRLDHP